MVQELRNSTMINSQAIQKVKKATIVNTQAISKLEMQMGELANHLGERDKRKFPNQPVTNPKACMIGNSSNQEHAHAIVTLRSGKRVDNQVAEPEVDLAGKVGQDNEKGDNKEERDAEPSIVTPIVKEPLRSFVPKAPYPERLQAPKKRGQSEEILEVFKQVQINILFLDVIQQISSYAKFLNDLITVKRKTNVPKKAFMTEQLSVILHSKLPLKYKDPGCLTITCTIGLSQI